MEGIFFFLVMVAVISLVVFFQAARQRRAQVRQAWASAAKALGLRCQVSCLGNLDKPIVPGFLRSAHVKLWFFGDAFERFLAGELPAGKKELLVQGDLDVLERFGRLLLPAASALSVRFTEVRVTEAA